MLEPLRLPTSVDQPQWLVRLPDDSLVSLESERWASPLRDEFRQALLAELVGRFGLVDARDDRAFTADAWRIRIDVMRFESIAGREARIEGAWTISAPLPAPSASGLGSGSTAGSRSPGTAPSTAPPAFHCTWRYVQPVGPAVQALAAGHRQNVARLADAIGQAVTRLQAGIAAQCSAD